MTQGKRPGGLTALAVINFILGAYFLLDGFMVMAMVLGTFPAPNEEAQRAIAEVRELPYVWAIVAGYLGSGVLLIVSGIGYMRQHRVMGRWVGTAYGVVGLALAVLAVTAQPFQFISAILFVYPVLTLLLLNLTFRDDLVHGAERFLPPPPDPSPSRAAPDSEREPAPGAVYQPGRGDRLLTGLRLEHVRLIAQYWIRFSLRTGGGLVTLLLVLMVGISVAGVFFAPVENLLAQGPDAGFTEGEVATQLKEISESPQFVEVVQRVTGTDASEATYLLSSNPAVLSVIFLVLMWLFPFVACVGSFNQTASDISSRGLRYLLLRTERPNVLAGRFVGTVSAATAALGLMVVMMLLYVGIKFRIYPGADLALWGLQGFVAITLLVLPYIALCTWISCSVDSAIGSLAMSLALVGGTIISFRIIDATLHWDLAWMQRLMPWGWKYELLSGDVGTRITAYLVMLGFTLLFLFLAFRSFHKRDL